MSAHSAKAFFFISQAIDSGMALQDRFGAPHVVDSDVALLAPHSDRSEFHSFMKQHDKAYSMGSDEYESRHALYQASVENVAALNARPDMSWTAGLNVYADWTAEELRSLRGLRHAAKGNTDSGAEFPMFGTSLSQTSSETLPDEVSWANLTALKQIQNQGYCGSCWAIATRTMLESTHEIHRGHRSFSAQELVNCVQNQHHCGGTGGCQGATMELALQYTAHNGLSEEGQIPYTAYDQKCTTTSLIQGSGASPAAAAEFQSLLAPGSHATPAGAKGLHIGLTSWRRLPENKYEPLLQAVAQDGPVAVSVDAAAWQSYSSGIFDGCSKDAVIDHAVTLIGYGANAADGKKYWVIQNSWGEGWGMAGRILLLRQDSDDQNCGIDRNPKEGVGCDGGPSEVTVCGQCGILYDTAIATFAKP